VLRGSGGFGAEQMPAEKVDPALPGLKKTLLFLFRLFQNVENVILVHGDTFPGD
jgi:hypothetical protein